MLRSKKQEFGDADLAEICGKEYWGEGSYTEKKLKKPA